MSNPNLKMWQDDKLDRVHRAISFAKIVQQNERARVISVEGGFGSGKTFFRTRWAKHLRELGETVIEFDAWKSDHSGDPLLAFSFELLRSLQGPIEKKGVGSHVRELATTVAKAGVRRGSQMLVGEAVDQVGDAFGEVLEAVGVSGDAEGDVDASGLSKVATDGLKAMRKSMSQEASKILLSQFEAERVREVELPQQLQSLRKALKASGQSNGRVVVLIDELDRCRPDYAISLLEAIKHLFDEQGFIFVLFLNPSQLASTAARLFGEVESGEPYFTKFIDLRLDLGATSSAAFCEAHLRALFLAHSREDEIETTQFKELLQIVQHVAQELELTPRQIEKAFTLIDVTLATSDEASFNSVVEVSLYVTSHMSEEEVAERMKSQSRKILERVFEIVTQSANLIVRP